MLNSKKLGIMGIATAVFFWLFFLFFFTLTAEARQGCCSHHGGVCGCGCCDGTALSATCAPYYPECNSKPAPTSTPASKTTPVTPVPTTTENAKTDTSIDSRIKEKINSVKKDYPDHHQGFRESLIHDIVNMLGSDADIKEIGFYVYTMLPDVKDEITDQKTYTCNCYKTCPEMSSCEEAQYQLNVCGCTARDADHDGIACDNECQ